jgi:hypothetical protein
MKPECYVFKDSHSEYMLVVEVALQ